MPIMPNPNDPDTNRVIRQLIDMVKYFQNRFQRTDLEAKLDSLQRQINEINDAISA